MQAASGVPKNRARTMIGKWISQNSVGDVIDALGRAQREGAIEPVAFIEGVFRFKAKSKTFERPGYTLRPID